MRFYTKADAALLEQVKVERDSLRAQIPAMVQQVQHYQEMMNEAIQQRDKAIADAKARPTQPTEPTREQIARMLRIPEHLIDQIDLDRMGVQVAPSKRHQ